jgi:hypothetical protein
MRQSARLSPHPVYGLPDVANATEHSGAPSAVLPLLVLFIVFAAATVWFVALPAFHNAPRAERSCEVIVLESGSTKCVREPMRGSRAASGKTPSRHG